MNNFIEIYENALSDDLCDLLINEINYQHSQGNSWKGGTGLQTGIDERVKDSIDFDLVHWYLNESKNGNSPVTLNGIMYKQVMSNIGDMIMDCFLKYNKKYEYYGEFINKNVNSNLNDVINERWEKVGIKNNVMDMEYIKKRFRFKSNLLVKRYKKNEQGYHVFHGDLDDSLNTPSKRSHVCMAYLNDVKEGGETEWYHQKLKVKPKKGTIVIWPVYFTHLHKGNIPISNDKYILNTWIEPSFNF